MTQVICILCTILNPLYRFVRILSSNNLEISRIVNDKDRNGEVSQINRITGFGIVVNLGLACAKISTGMLIGSLGLISDGFHTLSDLITDFTVLIGSALANRPADRNHPFGHGKFETFSAVTIALVLLIVGAGLAWKSFTSLIHPTTIPNGWWVIGISLLSLVIKELLYHATMRIAVKCRSAVLRANAWHHRSDAISSVVVLVGGITALVGWTHGDAVAGMVVGLMIMFVGGRIGGEAIVELSESSAGDEIEAKIAQAVENAADVRGWHRLRTRRIGREMQMDIHILLDPEMTIERGHQIVQRLENDIQDSIDWPVTITIHVDPDIEVMRVKR